MNKITSKAITALLCAAMAFGSGEFSAVPVLAAGSEVSVEASEADPVATATLTISGVAASYTYTGSDIEPQITVKYTSADKKTTSQLTQGTDYTVSYTGNRKVGKDTAKVTVTGRGDKYSDLSVLTAEKTFSITKATPTITLTSNSTKTKTYDGKALTVTEGTDYSVNFSGLNDSVKYYKGSTELASAPTDAGDYSAKITYAETSNTNSQTATISLKINPKSITGSTVTLSSDEFSYNGKAHMPAVTVTDTVNGATKTLTAYDKDYPNNAYDYKVNYLNNTNVSTDSDNAYVEVNGHGNYTGTKSVPFTIKSADLSKTNISSGLTITGINDKGYAYTGSEIKPAITVKNGTTTLKPGTDYTLTYSNNINPGQATITITGKGSYTNSCDVQFTINPADLDGVTISSIPDQTYNGDQITPDVTVKKGNITLVKDTDYTVDTIPSPATNAGSYKLIITAIGNSFSGSREVPFKIVPKSLSGATFDIGENAGGTFTEKTSFDYTGSNIEPATRVIVNLSRSRATETLTAGNDYTVSYSNNAAVGVGTVTVKGKGNYTGTLSKTFTIGQVKSETLNGAVIAAIADQTYTGSEIKPGVSVKLNGRSLSSSNYDVGYLNNVNAGVATVYITGKGSYGGSAQTTFKILPRNISAVSVTGLTAQKYTGFAVQPNLTLTYNGKTLRKGMDYTLTFTNNANIGNGNAVINGLGNFTGTVTKTFPIKEMKDGEEVKTYATAITVPETLDATAGNNVTITPAVTAPEDANTYKVRWSTSNPAFVFVDGNNTNTAETTDGTPAVVKAASEGSTVIKAELISDDGNVAGTYYTFIKATKSFTDVSTSTYYSTAVDALANYGYTTGSGASREFHATPVVNGNTTTTYNPAGPVTRGQFVTMMYNKALADYKAGKSTTDPSKTAASGFSDVGSSAYYASAVNWASANGIAQGTSASTFNPNGTVTRAEAVTFLQRWLGGTASTSSQFTDVSSSSYYSGAVGWAVKNGVTNGTSATTFEPGTKCNRGQAATFIYRAAF